jgi:hypothetical protein
LMIVGEGVNRDIAPTATDMGQHVGRCVSRSRLEVGQSLSRSPCHLLSAQRSRVQRRRASADRCNAQLDGPTVGRSPAAKYREVQIPPEATR